MMDIAHNAPKGVSFESILARNKLLYDYDLEKVPKKEFKKKLRQIKKTLRLYANGIHCRYAINRLMVLRLFHTFCAQTSPLDQPDAKFSAWLLQNGHISAEPNEPK